MRIVAGRCVTYGLGELPRSQEKVWKEWKPFVQFIEENGQLEVSGLEKLEEEAPLQPVLPSQRRRRRRRQQRAPSGRPQLEPSPHAWGAF